MEQAQIFDYLGVKDDPIFNKISCLKKGQVLDLGGVRISVNIVGLFEVETVDCHESFKSLKQVYEFLLNNLDLRVL